MVVDRAYGAFRTAIPGLLEEPVFQPKKPEQLMQSVNHLTIKTIADLDVNGLYTSATASTPHSREQTARQETRAAAHRAAKRAAAS